MDILPHRGLLVESKVAYKEDLADANEKMSRERSQRSRTLVRDILIALCLLAIGLVVFVRFG